MTKYTPVTSELWKKTEELADLLTGNLHSRFSERPYLKGIMLSTRAGYLTFMCLYGHTLYTLHTYTSTHACTHAQKNHGV